MYSILGPAEAPSSKLRACAGVSAIALPRPGKAGLDRRTSYPYRPYPGQRLPQEEVDGCLDVLSKQSEKKGATFKQTCVSVMWVFV